MPTQFEKIARFRQLHERDSAFMLANAWTVGSARMLTQLGFEAIGTTSAGLAIDLGVEDGQVGKDLTLANAKAIAAATDLPVSADLENGFGDEPRACAETIRQAIDSGLAGASIEDATRQAGSPIYPFDLAVARVQAAVEVAQASDTGFVVTARAENFGWGRADLPDTIARLKAFEAVGADVLFAPRLPSFEAIEAVCAAVGKPVNVLMPYSGLPLSVDDLARIGVRRISLGSALARTAQAASIGAARWVRDRRTFLYERAAEATFAHAK